MGFVHGKNLDVNFWPSTSLDLFIYDFVENHFSVDVFLVEDTVHFLQHRDAECIVQLMNQEVRCFRQIGVFLWQCSPHGLIRARPRCDLNVRECPIERTGHEYLQRCWLHRLFGTQVGFNRRCRTVTAAMSEVQCSRVLYHSRHSSLWRSHYLVDASH